jgi:glycosyltransferase involved in cell wall biosynthesis
MDTQFHNTFKQRIGSMIFRFNLLRRLFFTNVWIPGFPQFEAASRFGFNYDEIIFGLLSGDTEVFYSRSEEKIRTKKFLFVGRLENVKGVNQLIDTWSKISKIFPDWQLVIAGDGALKNRILQLDNIIYKGFLNPNEVALLMNDADCLVLPSNYEPWGLVIHEAVLCGLPIICTDKCGAHSFFLIDDFNGFLIQDDLVRNLFNCMIKFINLKDEDFKIFSSRSIVLGSQISTIISAAHFNSKLLK